MKNRLTFSLLLLVSVMVSCTTPKYIHDPTSLKTQQQLQNARSANVFFDVCATVFNLAVNGESDGPDLTDRQFKKIYLHNATSDTMYVNMLSDLAHDDGSYCDFMDIRIPGNKTCTLMLPLGVNYNLYFSPTPQNDDDEQMEINTSKVKRIALSQGLTFPEN